MSRKSGIFNFIKLPNLMVGLVAACVCFTCGDAWAVPVEGCVTGNYGVGSNREYEPLVEAYVCVVTDKGETKKCVFTDKDGCFKIDISSREYLYVSFVGCEPYKKTFNELGLSANSFIADRVEPELYCVTEIEEVTSKGCRRLEEGINSGDMIGDICVPSSCVEPRWVLRGRDNDAECVEQECRGGNWYYLGTEWKCHDGEIIEVAPDAAPEEDDYDNEDDDDSEYTDEPESDNTDYESLAEEAREREQSTGNKLIGALGMGATGIGGSMLMSGLAESAADDDAERAMTAYLETFTCKYGNESVSGGTMNVEVPGGNELINMYSEYVALANDLKMRKTALGMKPGIESEPILDSATTGLYDDVGTGRGKGVYASLARALEDPDGEDAKAWAAQREESEKKTKTGAIVAGIGAVGSLIGNVAINADWDKNKHKALRDLEEDVNNIQPSRDRCPNGADGVYAPDCDCSGVDGVYNANMNHCDACPSGMIAGNNSCECPEANQTYVSGRCVDAVATEEPANEKVADDGSSLQTAVLSADAMFAFGSHILRTEAEGALDKFINDLREAKLSDCAVRVVGYADPSGSDTSNKTLSERRASTVADYLRKNGDGVIKSAEPQGKGEDDCTCGLRSKIKDYDTSENGYEYCKDKSDETKVNDDLRYAPCRRVEVTLDCAGAGNLVGVDLLDAAGNIAGGVSGSIATVLKGQ